MSIIAFQPELCPVLPLVVGNVDYQEFRTTLERIDTLLMDGGVEAAFMQACLQEVDQERAECAVRAGSEPQPVGGKDVIRISQHAGRALRCNIARALVGESFRDFSCRLADSSLLQWFCGLGRMDVVHVPSKSTLDRYSRFVPEDVMREVIAGLTRAAVAVPTADGQRRWPRGPGRVSLLPTNLKFRSPSIAS